MLYLYPVSFACFLTFMHVIDPYSLLKLQIFNLLYSSLLTFIATCIASYYSYIE